MKVLLYYGAQLAKSESCFISAWDYLGFIDIAENFCEEAIYWLFLGMIHFEPDGKHIITQRNALNQRTRSYNAKRWGSNQGQPEDLLSFYIQSEGEQLSEKYILCGWWRPKKKRLLHTEELIKRLCELQRQCSQPVWTSFDVEKHGSDWPWLSCH